MIQSSVPAYRCKMAERNEKNFKGMPSNSAGVWENDRSYVLLVKVQIGLALLGSNLAISIML